MGIYDRDYERDQSYGEEAPIGFQLGGPQTLTTSLVLLMFAIYGVQLLTRPDRPATPIDDGWFTNIFRLYGDVFLHPWRGFELLTYGFLHDVDDLKHILFNMFGLWMFGRIVEQRYGRQEFLLFFLAAIVFSGVCWVVGEFLASGKMLPIPMLGASGGIAAVLILFALSFPRQHVFLFGLLPMPAWLFAVLFVGLDLMGAMNRGDGSSVAYTAHLGGALWAAIYFKSGLRLERWLPSGSWQRLLRPGPKLRVHHPEADDDTDRKVDEILQKIQEHGQDSLTRRERGILEQASREYQKRRK